MMRWILLGLTAAALAPLPALAQTWQEYTFPGVAFQAPAKPEETKGVFESKPGVSVPAVIYTAKLDNVIYSLTVADFTGKGADPQTEIAHAEKALGAAGKVTFSVEARIDAEYGRELSLAGPDGSRSAAGVFFVDQHLYELVGTSLPPDAAAGSGNTIRFQQSLRFVGERGPGGGGPRAGGPGGGRRGRGPGGPGGGGLGGPRGGPNPQALEACMGKKAGDAVSLTTPQGDVPATCTLVARPDRPPPPGD